VIFIGNYQGDDTEWHLWVKKMMATPNFRYFRTTALEAVAAGIMPQEAMDTARATLPEGIFNALYLCQGSSDPSLLVRHAAVADLWSNSFVPEGKKALTCDIALHGSDRFVMHAWSGMILKEITVLTKRDASDVTAIIQGKAIEHQVPRHNIVYDADGLGAYLKGYLQGATPYQGGRASEPQQGQKMSYQNLRSQCHFLAADAINDGKMWIDTDAYRDELEPEIFACLRTSGQDAALRWGIIPKDSDNPKMPGAKRRLGRSPDLFDPIPMRMFLEMTPSPMFLDQTKQLADRERKRIVLRRDKPSTTFGER
jgi:hypothetical protein